MRLVKKATGKDILNNQRTTFLFLALMVFGAATLVGLTWANYSYAVQNEGINDFAPRWVGARNFLLEGTSPYSDETTSAIQQLVYGQAAAEQDDQALFLYPLYSIYLIAPFALISDYFIARAVWMTVLEIAVIALMLVSLSLSHWKVPAWMMGILLLFSLFWMYGFQAILAGNISILIALFIALSFLAIRAGNDGLAGFLLALAAIKPQVIVLLVIFVLIWGASQNRWQIFWGFVSSTAFFVVTALLFISDWIWQFLRQLVAFADYAAPILPGSILKEALPGVGSQLGWAFTIVMATALIVEWRAARGREFNWFYWAALLTLAATTMIGIPASSGNFIVLYPALILVLSAWAQQWGASGRWLIAVSMLSLFFGLWWFNLRQVAPMELSHQSQSLYFLLPLFLFITLYWVRWWVLRPARPLMEQFRRLDRQRSNLR